MTSDTAPQRPRSAPDGAAAPPTTGTPPDGGQGAARRELGRSLAARCPHGVPRFKCWEHGHMAADEPDDDYRTMDGQLKDWLR